MNVRVRFAPSPTGFLHIGGARTALFNWLFARRMGGAFVLRIEDTDEARSTQESVEAIFHGLKWLGLNWDEGPMEGKSEIENRKPEIGNCGPYFQMERLPLYRETADKLIAAGQAYPCYCTPEEVEIMREKALALKRTPKYDGTCRRLTAEQRKAKESEGRTASLRFASPTEGTVEFQDIIRGDMKFEAVQMEDFVLLKSSGVPTYNFACVVDDHHMNISHVIRGDDHLSNTPRQVLIYRALGWTSPVFAHLSMILGPDGSRLSKRHGATSVQEYESAGHIPEALRNYLALLGWSTEESQQLFGQKELIEKFSVERCMKSPAVFDPAKLEWMNGEYARAMPVKELVDRAMPFIKKAGFMNGREEARRGEIEAIVTMEHDKIKLLTDVVSRIEVFFKPEVEFDAAAVEKVFKAPGTEDILREAMSVLRALEPFTAASTEEACKGLAQKRGVKNGVIYHPVRVAVSGRTQGASLFHMLELLGRDRCTVRMQRTLELFPILIK